MNNISLKVKNTISSFLFHNGSGENANSNFVRRSDATTTTSTTSTTTTTSTSTSTSTTSSTNSGDGSDSSSRIDNHIIYSERILSTKCPTSDVAASTTYETTSTLSLHDVTISSPQDKDALMRRIQTFSPITWCAKPVALSPVVCARFGWQNVDVDRLQCVSCKVYLNAHLSEQPDIYEACYQRLKDNLQKSHHKCCPWYCHPSPEFLYSVIYLSRDNAIQDYLERYKSFSVVKQLPALEQTDIVSTVDLNTLRQLCIDNSVPTIDQFTEASMLSLTGWRARSRDLLHCRHCFRQIGLWSFTDSQQNNSSLVSEVTEVKVHGPSQSTDATEQNIETEASVGDSGLQGQGEANCLATLQRQEDSQNTGSTDNTPGTINSMTESQITEGEGEEHHESATASCQIISEANTSSCDNNNDDDDDDDEPLKKRRKCCTTTVRLLNPLTEHNSWCLWVNNESSASASEMLLRYLLNPVRHFNKSSTPEGLKILEVY